MAIHVWVARQNNELVSNENAVMVSNENAVTDEILNAADRGFSRMVADVRRHAEKLINAINRLDYHAAWNEKYELLRALSLVVYVVERLPHGDRKDFVPRLNAIKATVATMLKVAPTPSARALAQLRDTLHHLPRPERCAQPEWWHTDEQQWIADRLAAGPLTSASIP